MKVRLSALAAGMSFGFLLSWTRLTDPDVIGEMLLLRDAYVFLIMGSAVLTAAIGIRVLRLAGSRAWVTGEPIAWVPVPAGRRHVVGSVLFGAGWSVARTCPGPVAAMIGEGRVTGLVVAAGILAGVALQNYLVRKISAVQAISQPVATAAGF